MVNIILAIHVLAAIAIVVLVLLQQGKGADMGAAFGSSQTVFGAQGSANFLSRMTAMLATIFFLTSMSLAYIYGQRTQSQSVTEQVPGQEQTAPAQPAQSPETTSPTNAAGGGESTGTGAGQGTETSDIPAAPDVAPQSQQGTSQ